MRNESWGRVIFHKIAPSVQSYSILESKIVYINPPTKAVFSNVNISYQNNMTSTLQFSVHVQILTNRGVTEQNIMDYTFKKFLKTFFADKGFLFAVWINILPYEVRIKFINMSKSIHPEDDFAQFKLLDDITATTYKTREEPIEFLYYEEMREELLELFEKVYHIIKDKLIIEAVKERSNQESTIVKIYTNVMLNETCRMMTSIDMVVSEANHLFGVERTQIFFDLLDDEWFHFGSAGAIPDFVPNMAESAVRQHVIAFFEFACDMMNRLLTLILGCPVSSILQQIPEEKFISLLQDVIGSSSLKTKTKGGKRLSSKEITFVMVNSEEFVRALGDEIPDDVLERLRRGDEMVVHRFVDTRHERTQASERRENRPIHSIYFPSDCRLFIYIPTENGSYWHQLDRRRANRIRRHG